MTPDQRDQIMLRVNAVWPTPAMTDESYIVWTEHLARLDYDQAIAALNLLEKTKEFRPALSEMREQYDALAKNFPKKKSLPPPQCGVCEDGWVWTRCNTKLGDCTCGDEFERLGNVCPFGYKTMGRCLNGCRPLSMEQRAARDRELEHAERIERRRAMTNEDRMRQRLRDFTMPTPKQDEQEEVF